MIDFRTSNQHANADALSILPLREAPEVAPDLPEVVLMVENMDDSLVSAKDIASETKCDPVLSHGISSHRRVGLLPVVMSSNCTKFVNWS